MLWRIQDDVCKLLRKSCVRVSVVQRAGSDFASDLNRGQVDPTFNQNFSHPMNQNL